MREFGENVAKGTIYAINPALIIILVPLFTAATTDQDPLTVIHYGTYISAASVFCLVLSTSISACVAFVTLLSIGEAIWSPRLYDYTMSVCEEGREGTFQQLLARWHRFLFQ
jgi:POT family proton-dependent oligopeptide transporter